MENKSKWEAVEIENQMVLLLKSIYCHIPKEDEKKVGENIRDLLNLSFMLANIRGYDPATKLAAEEFMLKVTK